MLLSDDVLDDINSEANQGHALLLYVPKCHLPCLPSVPLIGWVQTPPGARRRHCQKTCPAGLPIELLTLYTLFFHCRPSLQTLRKFRKEA
ncbi:hypothetical protein Pcinc_038437 [Petrolisthes cinctipes]|uniref:Uncharacterized protein n=1 Tax=Petrolisthes cinctipes TaxID=88211 RepID=A0AAE1BR04_PETCI|nr:hypothetical protein Pcinc_038437 [Petrolisthes cinctipes]